MKLTTNQVGEKLGVTTATVRALIKRGLLHDVRTYPEGHKRKDPLLASKEVNAFAKEYRKHAHTKRYTNGHASTSETGSPVGVLSSIMARLNTVDAKVDRLLKIWS